MKSIGILLLYCLWKDLEQNILYEEKEFATWPKSSIKFDNPNL